MGIRFHDGAIRSNIDLLGNIQVIDTMITLLERRRYDGRFERRRRSFLGRLYRARMLFFLKSGDHARSREAMLRALGESRFSLRSGLIAPFVLAAPGLTRKFLSPAAKQFSADELAQFRGEAAPAPLAT
jgi:hypothetical protein